MNAREQVLEIARQFNCKWDETKIQRFSRIVGMPFDLRHAAYQELLSAGFMTANDARALENIHPVS